MTSIADLFDDRRRGQVPTGPAPRAQSRRLAALVGGGRARRSRAGSTGSAATSLASVFGGQTPAAPDAEPRRLGRDAQSERLGLLVGPPVERRAARPAARQSLASMFADADASTRFGDAPVDASAVAADTVLLRDRVAARAHTAPRPVRPIPAATSTRRPPRRSRDWTTTVVAALAVLAVAAATTFGVVLAATASPTADALAGLARDEAILINRENSVAVVGDRLAESAAAARADADAAASVLPELDGIANPDALAALAAARESFVTRLDGLSIRPYVAVYRRAQIDTDDLASIARALDGVHTLGFSVDEVADTLARQRDDLDDISAEYAAALAAFAQTLPGSATEVAAANPDAEAQFRDALTGAAAAAAPAYAAGDLSAAPLQAYAAAAAALGADQERALAELDAAQDTPQSFFFSRPDPVTGGDSVGGEPAPGTPAQPEVPAEPEVPVEPEAPSEPDTFTTEGTGGAG